MIDVQVINLTVILRGRFEEEPKRKYQKEKSDEENSEKALKNWNLKRSWDRNSDEWSEEEKSWGWNPKRKSEEDSRMRKSEGVISEDRFYRSREQWKVSTGSIDECGCGIGWKIRGTISNDQSEERIRRKESKFMLRAVKKRNQMQCLADEESGNGWSQEMMNTSDIEKVILNF